MRHVVLAENVAVRIPADFEMPESCAELLDAVSDVGARREQDGGLGKTHGIARWPCAPRCTCCCACMPASNALLASRPSRTLPTLLDPPTPRHPLAPAGALFVCARQRQPKGPSHALHCVLQVRGRERAPCCSSAVWHHPACACLHTPAASSSTLATPHAHDPPPPPPLSNTPRATQVRARRLLRRARHAVDEPHPGPDQPAGQPHAGERAGC